ncbi:MAG: hypothetical protein NTV79_03145, partial [Candidatus Aureabacteria bacterium]|nr:hypothetical protein [Candidatus Auribacterota bacterium]
MATKSSCGCGGTVKLVFPCSGASDTGEIADRAARKLSAEGTGNMYCLAGIGGGSVASWPQRKPPARSWRS